MFTVLISIITLTILANNISGIITQHFRPTTEEITISPAPPPQVLSGHDERSRVVEDSQDSDEEVVSKVEIKNKVETNPQTDVPLPPTSTNNDNANEIMNSLKYPNSSNLSLSRNSLTAQSSDDPAVITDWYKAKISALSLSAKSFVNTKANDKVLNKLVGSNGQLEVAVEISRENSQSPTQIKVSLNYK